MRPTTLPRPFRGRTHSLNASLAEARRRAFHIPAALAVVLVLAITAAAQAEYTNNKPDQALKADARVDPSTLGMSIGVPFGGAPGRAGVSLPISLRYSSKLWRMETGPGVQLHVSTQTWGYPRYSENSVAGWTSSLEPPRIEFTGEEQLFGYNGQPQGGAIDDPESYSYYVRRIHLHLPDGSSHELRKDDATPSFPSYSPSFDFSGMYYAVDGSRIRYDYDAGVLYLPDGGRYIFGARHTVTRYGHAQDGRWGTTYIDRHGNTMTYDTGTRSWTDTLGRTFSNPLPDSPTDGQVQNYTVTGVGGHPLTYKLYWESLGEVLRVTGTPHYTSSNFCVQNNYPAVPSPGGLFIAGSAKHICADQNPFNPVVLSKIELPNGQSYEFKYNVHGEIEQVIHPGGGYERFGYGQVATLSRANAPYDQANRGVVDRWVSPSGTGSEETTHHWQYSITKSTGFVTVSTTEPYGTRSERLINANSFGTQYGFETPLAGMAYDERVYNASNQMLRRTLTEWSTITPPGSSRPRNPHVTKSIGLVLDTAGAALASATTMAYDGDLNVTAKDSYDYASIDQTMAQANAIDDIPIPNGAPARTDETTYLVNDPNIPAATRDAYRARNLVGLPSSTRVKKGAVVVTQSEVKYDEGAYNLPPYGPVTGWTDPGTGVRGNATTMRSWINTSDTWIETHAKYDQVGNVRITLDAKGNTSEVEYSAAHHYAYPTHTKSAVPDPANQRGANTALEAWTAYDGSTGKVISTTDANNKTTVLKYVDDANNPDSLDRLRKVEHPDGGWVKYFYTDTPGNLHVYAVTIISTTQAAESYQFFDGLGRAVRSFTNEGGSGASFITSDTQYDALGRVSQVSNPYRSNGPGAAVNPSGIWTTSAYDALGRVSSVTTPDNAQVTTAYSGNEVTVTDQAGRRRKSVTDALGRLRQVIEAPDTATCQTDGAGCSTDYEYDALGNLRKVEQGGQLRFFMYDSLGRLIRAKNPEQGNFAPDPDFPSLTDATSGTSNNQWSVGYTYDANGNLSKRRDARNITATYTYDPLNRLLDTTYSDGVTPGVNWTYDKATNGRGRFAWNWTYLNANSANSHRKIVDYDAMGRPTWQQQYFWINGNWGPQDYSVHREYDLAGNVTSQTYPSNHTANYPKYDAAGRLKKFTGNLGDGTQRTYATGVNPVNGVEEGIQYDEAGRLSQEKFGTQIPLYHKQQFNVRGQLKDIRLGLGHDKWSTERGVITINYGGTSNNGNVVYQQYWIPTDASATAWDVRQTNYAYDGLNRVAGMQEFYGPAGVVAQQAYTYDRWGNRQINEPATSVVASSDPLNEVQFEMGEAAAKNRLLAPGDMARAENGRWMRYDNAGNLTEDIYTGKGACTYDAENRMTSATIGINATAFYTYDADGRRVRRQTPDEQVWQVYGMEGELLAEYAANAAPFAPRKEYGYRNGELLITAQGTAGTNLALNKTATQSSTYDASVPASRAVDGTTAGSHAAGTISHTNNEANAWWHVDLGSVQAINSIKVWNRADCCTSMTSDFYVLVSDAPFTSTNLSATLSQAGVSNYHIAGEAGAPTTAAVGRTGRYVRVQLAGSNYLTLSEVEVWGTAAPANVALNRTATQSSTFDVSAPASRAVDGNTAGSHSAGTISHTNQDANAWWHVDLGSVQAISTVKVWNRADCCTGTTADFYVLVSDAPFTSTSLSATLSQAGVSNYHVAGEAGAPTTITVGRSGRYVRVQLVGTNYLTLSEVEVFDNPQGSGAGMGTGEVQWLVTDQLGTPRMIADLSGSLAGIKRHDYLPFGEEVGAGVGGRTTGQGYVSDNVRQKFTSKERDTETGLDYFGERYYSSSMGRFISIDPLGGSAKISNPQSMNRYTYVLNNPLRYVDPDGLEEKDPWDQLSQEEKDALNGKLQFDGKKMKIRDKFNSLVQVLKDGKIDAQATAANIDTIKNFIAAAGGLKDSATWNQINTIDVVRSSELEVTVFSQSEFVKALKDERYSTDGKLEASSSIHKGISLRAQTDTVLDPELHFTNDIGQGVTSFGAHWDPTSVNPRRTITSGGRDGLSPIPGELIAAGMQHLTGQHASPGQVREYLKRTNQMPSKK